MSLYIIPPMTHELSRAWLPQPDQKNLLIDGTHVIMSKADFDILRDYTCSRPSGVYEGKMWKSQSQEAHLVTEGEHKGKYRKGATYGKWYLNWWDFSDDPNKCRCESREILIMEL